MSWKQDTIYLTIGNNQNQIIKEAYLHETTAHRLVTVDEVLLQPKETTIVPMKFETWRGRVPNFKNKPALVSTTAPYAKDGLIIDEIVTDAHKNGMLIRITNAANVGTCIPCHAHVASFRILSEYSHQPEVSPIAGCEISPTNTTERVRVQECQAEQITDISTSRTCLCKIPNKLMVADVMGNNNNGLLHEHVD